MTRQKKILAKIHQNNEQHTVQSLKTAPNKMLDTNPFLNSEINIRCVLGAFIMGTGASDVGKFMSMIGVGGGSAFERQFFLNQERFSTIILRRCRSIVRKGMLEEIAITMKEQFKDVLS